MNPMSLLTMSTDQLREASLRNGQAGPRGEIVERTMLLGVAATFGLTLVTIVGFLVFKV